MITKFEVQNFTAFTDLRISFQKGINILLGENGTGKTHIMKVLYSACSIVDKRLDTSFDQKLKEVFLPNTIGRLVHRKKGRNSSTIKIGRIDEAGRERTISCTITTLNNVNITTKGWKDEQKIETVFIPVKDMLANAPGFRALYAQKELYYEGVYADIIDKAFIPFPRGKQEPQIAKLLSILQKAMSGRVVTKNENFYLKNAMGELEFPLLAEGFRKLGLLYTLICNGTLTKGTVLFWDEPEANLNPKLAKTLVQILLELQRMGVQIFISTHDYVLLKEFDLAAKKDDMMTYHTLYRAEDGDIQHAVTTDFDSIAPNAIDDTYGDLLNREFQKQYENNHR